jgi:hypothetical protein
LRISFYTADASMPHLHKLATRTVLTRFVLAAGLALLCVCPARAQAAATSTTTLPPRSQWHASSSSAENTQMAPAFAIDGDPTTKWGGAFAAHHWLQVDLGEVSDVAGVLLHWDSGFAASYRIVVSADGQEWEDVFETTDGQGGVDYVFFPTTHARYLRLASLPLSSDWGVSVLELEPLAAADAPQISGLVDGVDAATVWGGSAIPPRQLDPSATVTVKLPRPLATTGLEVFWGQTWRSARLDTRDETGKWKKLADDKAPEGDTSLLAARTPVIATELRMKVGAVPGKRPAIRRLRLLPPDRKMTPLRRYESIAARVHRTLFPLNVRNQQVYWTTVGVPAGLQKSIFDEFGNIEAYKGAPLVQPLWRAEDSRVYAAHNGSQEHSLRDGWMPMPAVEWTPEADLLARSEAMTIEQGGQPVTLLRHRLKNNSQRKISGELILVLRPVQINPVWQSGGIAQIFDVALEGKPDDTSVRVNGRTFVHSLSPVHARGAARFGAHGEDEITQSLVWGAAPTALKARDYDGLAAAYLSYQVKLAPGESRDVVLAFPLGNKYIDVAAGKVPDAPPLQRDALLARADNPGHAYDKLADEVAGQWNERLSRVRIELPDRSLTDMLRAQVAYMLINQTGNAMQPGPRNYNRSFIRDGSATAIILTRMGLSNIAREYLRWYTDHAVHENGLVSPILNNDGTVNRGFGSDLEHDSQGQYVAFVADMARLDGGPATVKEYLPKVKLALQFAHELRQRTLVPGYMADHESPERFRGLIAPSISHEGYPVPTHSYWDDYYALKGWHDGAWLAAALGNAEMETWARAQYAVLRESVAASIKATMAWKNISTVPSAADDGGYDPTSTSIGVDPCDQGDLMPRDALSHTFDVYMQDVRKRDEPGGRWAYTPYELRNVLTYVYLNRPADAGYMLEAMLPHRRPLPWQVYAEVVHSRLRLPKYLGDMPHTWIGVEYIRDILGMLMHEADDHLSLLPGAQPSWLQEGGLRVSELRTIYGKLSMSARQGEEGLHVTLDSGLLPNIPINVAWPSRTRPTKVVVDGQEQSDYTADGILLARPFSELLAQW